MEFNEYQRRAWGCAIYPDRGHNFIYPALGLAGEAGEVAEKVKKILRDDGGFVTSVAKAAVLKELGDVLWYVAAMAGELGFTLEDVAASNIEKLESRKARGTLGGSGDNR